MVKNLRLILIFLSLFLIANQSAYAGKSAAKLSNYFDSLLRERPEEFETWYPKAKDQDKIENPRSMSFDAAKALGDVWPSSIASATVASYRTNIGFAQFLPILDNPTMVQTWLRATTLITESSIVDRMDPGSLKVRMTIGIPFLDDVNGFYTFRHFMVSGQRLALRIVQLNEEGPASDHEIIILIDQNPDRTAFLHIVDVTILKPQYKNGLLARYWFNFRMRRTLINMVTTLSDAASGKLL